MKETNMSESTADSITPEKSTHNISTLDLAKFASGNQTEESALSNFIDSQIRKRISIICLLGSGFFLVPIIFRLLSHSSMGLERYIFFIISCNAVSFYFFIKNIRMSTNSLIVASLIYQVVFCYLFSCVQSIEPYTGDYSPRQIAAWTTGWIMIFPLIIPCSPMKTFWAALGSALGVVLAIKTGDFFFDTKPFPQLYRDTFVMYVPIVGVACLISMLTYKLNGLFIKEKQKNNYELLDLLGQGNMGSVWRVRHRMLHRPAAMKVVSSKYLDNKDKEKERLVLQRFEREAQATASLCSPNSIILYDFGRMEEGDFYYVMELLEGKDLQLLTKEFGPVSAERTVYFLLQVCKSLSDAHAKALIHRDIKPANIMVCKYGVEYDFIKVLDFGMVKREKQKIDIDEIGDINNNTDVTLTQVGSISGTPAFMAPEMSQQKPIDGRYDIYSLGCVAYWLLTGELVFSSKSTIGMIVAHLRNTPTPPSQKADIAVPEELDRIILWCLEKNPEDRPQTMDELAESLEKIEFENPWSQKKAKAWWLEKEKNDLKSEVTETKTKENPSKKIAEISSPTSNEETLEG